MSHMSHKGVYFGAQCAQSTGVWKYTDGDKHYNAVENEEMEQADCKNQWRQVTLKRYCVLYCDAVRMSFRH